MGTAKLMCSVCSMHNNFFVPPIQAYLYAGYVSSPRLAAFLVHSEYLITDLLANNITRSILLSKYN